MYQIPICDTNTVEPPNKGHLIWGQYEFGCCVLCREVVLSSEVLLGKQIFGTLTCREVYYTVLCRNWTVSTVDCVCWCYYL